MASSVTLFPSVAVPPDPFGSVRLNPYCVSDLYDHPAVIWLDGDGRLKAYMRRLVFGGGLVPFAVFKVSTIVSTNALLGKDDRSIWAWVVAATKQMQTSKQHLSFPVTVVRSFQDGCRG